METISLPVTDEGVLIPKTYLKNVQAIDVILHEGYVFLRPKIAPEAVAAAEARLAQRYAFIGIGKTGHPRVSLEVEEILEREMGLNSLPSIEA
jgi:hypothetical protein